MCSSRSKLVWISDNKQVVHVPQNWGLSCTFNYGWHVLSTYATKLRIKLHIQFKYCRPEQSTYATKLTTKLRFQLLLTCAGYICHKIEDHFITVDMCWVHMPQNWGRNCTFNYCQHILSIYAIKTKTKHKRVCCKSSNIKYLKAIKIMVLFFIRKIYQKEGGRDDFFETWERDTLDRVHHHCIR